MARGKKKESALTPEEKLAQALVPVEEQPYKVPKNWCWTRLAHIAKWGSGGTPTRKNPDYYEGSISWIKTGELNDDYIYETEEHISDEAVAHSSAKLFPINTIAIAMYGATIGKVGILGVEATTNQACACAVASQAIDYKYLFRFAQSQKDAFIKKGKGGAQPNISQEIIKEHEIPLPPIAEQQRIVDRIEYLFAKLDEAKEKAQSVLDSFETRKAAILHKAFTGELTAKWRAEHGVAMDTWEKCLLGDIFDLQAGKNISASKINSTRTGETPYPCFGGNGIRGYVEGFNREGEHPIIGRQGALCGNVNLAYGQFYATEHAVVVSYKREITTTWAVHYLRFLNLNQYATATAQPGLAVGNIVKIPVIYIPYEEQCELAGILDSLFTKGQQAKEAAEAVLEKIDLLKKSILARAFRGELGTNDPTEESALELLKKVL